MSCFHVAKIVNSWESWNRERQREDWQRGQKWEISIIKVKSSDRLALSFQDFSAKPEVVNN